MKNEILAKEHLEGKNICTLFKRKKERVLKLDRDEMCSFFPIVRNYLSTWDSLTTHDGVLKIRLVNNDGKVCLQVLVPSKRISEKFSTMVVAVTRTMTRTISKRLYKKFEKNFTGLKTGVMWKIDFVNEAII